ncbi:hypothetical protein PSHT_08481 [Puccinia striiformis]|uniref:Uncharacterized protein n=1 Tax=Puccinia striiformis TaxID=27350 RepID=A0A2S4VNS6_9BASI|nr:hypothetical protein PSHT_08481 [Puccinia striiformis]
MSQLADHTRDRELLYATLGGIQPVGTCLAWVVGLTMCEALRLTQRFDPKTSLIKRTFVYFSLIMSVALLSLFLGLIYRNAVVNYGQYRKLLEITDIFRFDYMVTRIVSSYFLSLYGSFTILLGIHPTCMSIVRRPWELVFSSTVKAHECLGEAPGLTYYSYDVWHSELGKIKMWRIPIIKVSIGVLYLGVAGIFILRIALVFLLVKIPDSSLSVEVANLQNKPYVFDPFTSCGLNSSAVDHLSRGQYVQVQYVSSSIGVYVLRQHLILIEGAVLTFLKAYDLVKSGAVKRVLATRDDLPRHIARIVWGTDEALFDGTDTAFLGIPCVACAKQPFSLPLPAPNGVSGTAYALSLAVVDAPLPFANRSISAELHLFGPIVAISAALDDMTLSSGELHCSLESNSTRETSQSILTSNQGRKVYVTNQTSNLHRHHSSFADTYYVPLRSFKTPDVGRRK